MSLTTNPDSIACLDYIIIEDKDKLQSVTGSGNGDGRDTGGSDHWLSKDSREEAEARRQGGGGGGREGGTEGMERGRRDMI